MTKTNKSGRSCAGPARILIVICLAVIALTIAACSRNGAEAKVASELDRLKETETAANRLTAVREVLPAESGKDFDIFLSKTRNFDYEIIGHEEMNDDEGEYTMVDVKIVTYDFGKEYLATWNNYLRKHKNASADDAEGKEFYKELFARLASIEGKEHISFVEIKAMEPMDNGEWVTDITSNEALQDAIFGGMISEMKTLADE